jgi:tRNA (mo5U34)-methyltransferase
MCQAMEQLRDDGADRQAIEGRVAALAGWRQRIALPHGVETPGREPLEAAAHRIPTRLDGCRVLDVGAGDGYWSFEALRRGAREVVALDDGASGGERFDLCRELLGLDPARCQRRALAPYDVDPGFGQFDVVFCFGLLNRLRHPLLALDRLAAVCAGELYVECAILDDYSPYRGGLGHGHDGGEIVMEFYPRGEHGGDPETRWAPTLACLGNLVGSAGFARVAAWKLVNRPPDMRYCRGFVRAIKPTSA